MRPQIDVLILRLRCPLADKSHLKLSYLRGWQIHHIASFLTTRNRMVMTHIILIEKLSKAQVTFCKTLWLVLALVVSELPRIH